MTDKIKRLAAALTHHAREIGCEPTPDAVEGAGADISEWTIEAISDVPELYRAYMDCPQRHDYLDRLYLEPALELAAALAPDPDCPECGGSGWYTGFLVREECRTCEGNNT